VLVLALLALLVSEGFEIESEKKEDIK